ncbi:MAG: hypothetical protein WBP47_19405, partial [Candidatus Promineifilaceae bacterium]
MKRSFSCYAILIGLLTAVWLLMGCRPTTATVLPTAAATAVSQFATPTAPTNQQPNTLPPTNTAQPTNQPNRPIQPTTI